jgi:hypothetical protein
MERTLDLLNRPKKLRDFLQETANQQRATNRLDRARPVLELRDRRSSG